jgi:hypothetical protein
MNLSLVHEKCKMLLTEGVVLGHHVSYEGIKFDLAKIEVIVRLPPCQDSERGEKLCWTCQILPTVY